MKPIPRTWRYLIAAALALTAVNAQEKKPNILVIWGDDIGTWNISPNSRGMMGYQSGRSPSLPFSQLSEKPIKQEETKASDLPFVL